MTWRDHMSESERALLEQLDRSAERHAAKLSEVHARRRKIRNMCVQRMRRNPNDTD